jgi:hypothetical protein
MCLSGYWLLQKVVDNKTINNCCKVVMDWWMEREGVENGRRSGKVGG